MGAPRWPPNPPTFGAPRRSRDTPLSRGSSQPEAWPPARRRLAAIVEQLAELDGLARARLQRGLVTLAIARLLEVDGARGGSADAGRGQPIRLERSARHAGTDVDRQLAGIAQRGAARREEQRAPVEEG